MAIKIVSTRRSRFSIILLGGGGGVDSGLGVESDNNKAGRNKEKKSNSRKLVL